jgi:hypothetical protein
MFEAAKPDHTSDTADARRFSGAIPTATTEGMATKAPWQRVAATWAASSAP